MYLLYFTLIPRIVPLNVIVSKGLINNWIYEAKEENSVERSHLFSNALDVYDEPSQGKLGCVGILYGDSIKAVALMELMNDRLYLCDLSSRDYYSGSMLMKTIVLSLKSEMILKNTVDERWVIAKLYFQKV